MTIKSRKSLILDLIGPEWPELFALEFKKNAIFDFVYTLASTIFNQSALNLAKIYMTIKSSMNLIMGLNGLVRLELFALELEKLQHLNLFTLEHLKLLTNGHQTSSNYTWR